jgi:uncharacterized NAD-dependent epimerase/dehydratase family protein
MLAFVKPAKVVGISVNTYNLNDQKAQEIISDIKNKTGLPTTDPVRFGPEVLTIALINYFTDNNK